MAGLEPSFPPSAVLHSALGVAADAVGLATHDDTGAKIATIAVWAAGLAATVLLWSRPAGAFFAKWRRR
jgi:hypothetical protein